MKLPDKLNGGFWKWTTAVGLMVIMFLLKIMAGDGLASWRVEEDLETHESEDGHGEQLIWNARIELRTGSVEADVGRVIELLEEQRDSHVRIETQLGIGRDGR